MDNNTKALMKRQLADVCRKAVAEYLNTMRGASMFGHNSEITPHMNQVGFDVRVPTSGGPEYFEVKVANRR